MADLTFRAASEAGSNTGTINNINVTAPAGTSSGDLQTIWCGVGVAAPGTPPVVATPSQWLLAGASGTISLLGGTFNIEFRLFYKIAGGGEGTVNLANNGGTNSTFSVVRKSYKNPDAAAPFVQVSWISAAGGPGTSVAVTGLTTSKANALIDVLIQQGAAQNCTPPGSMTERVDNSTYGYSTADEIIPAIGATGSRTFTLPASADYMWGIAEFSSLPYVSVVGENVKPPKAVQPKPRAMPLKISGWFPQASVRRWFSKDWWETATASTPNGTAAVTLGSDTSSATGTTTVVGTSARTLAGDASSASGTTTILGAASPTLGNDTATASGSVGSPVTGTVAVTLANDTASATGTTTVVGTSARTLAGDTSSATGTTTVVGSAAVTLGSDTSTASGSVGGAVSGSGSPTTGGDTSSASGTTTVVGSAAVTLRPDTAAASGTTPGPQVDEFAGFWAAAPRIRKRLDDEAGAAIEAAELIQQIATSSKDRKKAAKLEAELLAARTQAAMRSLDTKVRWAKALATELQRRDDDDIAAVLLLIE